MKTRSKKSENVPVPFILILVPKEREQKLFGDPLETIWKNCIFNLCGINNFYRRMFEVVVTSTSEQRGKWLTEVEKTVHKYFPAHNENG